jgi:hypothetical protein
VGRERRKRRKKGEAKKKRRKGKKRGAPAGFAAATAVGRARAPVGDVRHVARNEGKKAIGIVPVSGRRVAVNNFEGSGFRAKGI